VNDMADALGVYSSEAIDPSDPYRIRKALEGKTFGLMDTSVFLLPVSGMSDYAERNRRYADDLVSLNDERRLVTTPSVIGEAENLEKNAERRLSNVDAADFSRVLNSIALKCRYPVPRVQKMMDETFPEEDFEVANEIFDISKQDYQLISLATTLSAAFRYKVAIFSNDCGLLRAGSHIADSPYIDVSYYTMLGKREPEEFRQWRHIKKSCKVCVIASEIPKAQGTAET